MKSKYLLIGFIIFCIVGIFSGILVRSTELIGKNYVFGFDQGRDYLAVADIVWNKNITLIGSELGAGSAGFQGLFHGPFHYYFLSVPFFLSNGNPYSGIVLMYIFGVLTLLVSFLLGKKIFSTMGGLLLLTFVAISPPIISQSRMVWNSYPSSVFILLTFLAVYLAVKGNKKLLPVAAFLSVFIYNFQTALAIPLSLTLIIYTIFFYKLRDAKIYVLMVLGFLLGILPFILFELRHGLMGIRGVVQYIFVGEKTKFSLLSLKDTLLDHFNSFLFSFNYTFPAQNLIPVFILLPLLIVGTIYVYKRDANKVTRKYLQYLFILPFIAFGVFLFLRNSVYPYYLTSLNFTYMILFTYILIESFRKQYRYAQIIFGLLFVYFVVISIHSNIKMFLFDANDYGGDAKIAGKIDAIDYIYKDADGTDFNLLVFNPPVYTYAYDYLLLWYGKEKYGYIPPANKEGEVYLLIEVDHGKPWSYEGWLETVIKDGEIVKTEKLPSGFIVQKRVITNETE